MTGKRAQLDESGWHATARDFVPASHRDLPMLRIYLPFVDLDGNFVRWSKYVNAEEHPASLNWFEATQHLTQMHPSIRDLVSCMGELDASTAEALRDAISDLPMRCLRWVGYGEVPTAPSVRVFGEDYFEAHLSPADVHTGRRIPEFAWDPNQRLAWGARLYPDCLIVAAERSIFQQLHNDPRLDSMSVNVECDILPASTGD